MRVHEVIETEESKITIYGSNRPIKIRYAKPEWSEYEEQYFMYQGRRYYLSEFTYSNIEGYDGVSHDTFFSGVLVAFGDKDGDFQEEVVRAFTLIAS